MNQQNDAADQRRLEVAKQAARAAGELVLGFSEDLEVQYKTSRDLVTAADLAAQELIVTMIVDAFPDDTIVAEEGMLDVPESGYWVVDPLDGTVNFSRGLPLFGVSIAYVDGHGRIRVGAIHLPVLDELYWAFGGGGAFLNGRRITVSATGDLGRALVNVSDFNTGPEDELERYNELKIEAIRRVHGRCLRTKNLSSAAVELAWVAAGRLDAYLMVFCHFWDAAAGSLLIREAGGRVSDLRGNPFGGDSKIVLTSNNALHDGLRDMLSGLERHA